MNKVALVIGSKGQDGRLMIQALKKQDYQIIGVGAKCVEKYGLDYPNKIDITQKEDVFKLIQQISPAEIYYFSAFHHSSEEVPINELELFETSYKVNYFAYLYFLEAIRLFSPKTRIFYACSSMIFDQSENEVQTETSPYRANSAYAISKLDALLTSKIYREKYQVFACVGILFNHESVFRAQKFVTMKIIQGAIDIKNKKKEHISLGRLSAEVDLGYAPDFIDAMREIIALESPDDFIIATGQKHSIQDIAQAAFEAVDLNWKKYVKEDSQLMIRNRKPLVGDYRKLKQKTGWYPRTSFQEMIKLIVKEKLNQSK